jgi:UDP-N-acetylglucosamine 2-epimerase (non-hydrolysing)
VRHVAVVVGTRPEAIKMAPVVLALRSNKGFRVTIVSTGQHKELLDGVLEVFGLSSDLSLDVMVPGQSLSELTAKVLRITESVIHEHKFDLVLVHGDTTTAMATAMAAFFAGVPVAHVEAGLRTRNLRAPFPEELNRQVIARLATLNFAATELSASNLAEESVSTSSIHITGNTVVDSVRLAFQDFLSDDSWVESQLKRLSNDIPSLRLGASMVLVTLHRRENRGNNFSSILGAIRELAQKNPETLFVFPVHPNPIIKSIAGESLSDVSNVTLCEPMGYLDLLLVLGLSRLAISDSGGIQEEGVTLSTPVLVAREDTERPEGLGPGRLELVGSNPRLIVERAQALLSLPKATSLQLTLESNPFGSGDASRKISQVIQVFLGDSGS